MQHPHFADMFTKAAPSFDPRHVEAWMRLEVGTFGNLSKEKFASEVAMAKQCITEGGIEASEDLALSFGL